MFRLCLLFVLLGMICCMDAVKIEDVLEVEEKDMKPGSEPEGRNDLRLLKDLFEAEGRDLEEKKDLQKLVDLLVKKELEELLDVLKLKSLGSSSEEDNANTPTGSELEQWKEANVWGDGLKTGKELIVFMIEQLEVLIAVHDADVLANKYAEDTTFIYYSQDGTRQEAVGREETKKLFISHFSNGLDRFESNFEVLKGGKLGRDHMWLLNDTTLFAKNNIKIGALTNTVIFRRITPSESSTGREGWQVVLQVSEPQI